LSSFSREDDAILATALSGKADFLVTGDRQLLRLGTYRGVRIVTARDFLTILRQDVRS
jgi:predicted nucleic acid-binding protein